MSRNSSHFNKQNEIIRSLRRQLEATERELANQKWVFEQFLQSPSWRLTYPIRWIAKMLRAFRAWLLGILGRRVIEPSSAASEQPLAQGDAETVESADAIFDLKQCLTELYRVQLQSLLTSGASLQLPKSEPPAISIILVLFNRAELTLGCLRSLAENYFQPIEIIIVDNASTDETMLLLDRLRGVRIIRNAENRNFLLGVNQAAREARGEYLLILNNDTQVLPGTLQSALDTIRSAPDIGAVGGRLILLDGTLQEAGSIIWRDGSCLGYGRGDNPFAPMYTFRRNVDYCSAAFLLTPRTIWQQLGGFDEVFKPAYYEETDYCIRLWEHGLRVVYDPNSILLHYEFASANSAKSATDLQREHQRIFAIRYQNLLSKHYSPDVNSILFARMKNGQKRVLFIDDRVPHTWLGSGFPRASAVLQTLVKHDCFVTFYPFSFFDENWTSVYSDMPGEVEFMTGYGPAMLEPFLRTRRGYYDIILISRPHNMKILRPVLDAHPEWFEETNIIYDAEAIFVTREITFRRLNGAPLGNDEMNALLQQEMELASAADTVVAVSQPDGEEFRKHGLENVQIVGHSIAIASTPNAFDKRKGFLFVGAIHEEASPNGDSVIWFLEEILPKIRSELGSSTPFTIAGVNKSQRVTEFAGDSVRITGHLNDLSDLYNDCRVFVAPTRYAAGIPHKVHEAAARGIPVVATSLLASQLEWEDGNPFLVASDADSFAQKCIQLYKDAALWMSLREAGLNRVRRECSPQKFEQDVVEALKRVELLKSRA